MGHERVDEALGDIGDRSLRAEVNQYRQLACKRKSFEESIRRLEDQMFTNDVERHMCVSRLEAARAMVRIQHEMQDNRQAFRLSLWSLERGRLCYSRLAVVSDVDDGGVCPECRQGVERICRAITKQVQRSDARIEVDVMHTWNECTE
jgi:hypothetical protein